MTQSAQFKGQTTFLKKITGKFNGPQTLGNSRFFWICLGVVVLLLFIYPKFVTDYQVNNTGFLLVWTFLGLSLCILWGFTNIFSFGQTVFFGAGGYIYGIIGINLLEKTGNTNLAFLGGVLSATILALVTGYIMFYGGVSDVYVAIFTLMLTLVFEVFMAQTAGLEWRVGDAFLGGYNGMTNIPSLQFGIGEIRFLLLGRSFYFFALVLLILIYAALRLLVNSNFGYVMVAIREDPKRTEMFGYDIRKIRLIVFTIGGALAGLSGVLYVAWNNYISPQSLSMTAATLPVVWVAAGGRKSLIAAILSTFFLQYISQYLAYTGVEYALLIVGFFILGVVLVFPEGLIPSAVEFGGRFVRTIKQNAKK